MMSVGIDISKEKVDIAVYDGTNWTYKNSEKGTKEMIREVKKMKLNGRLNKQK